MSIALITGAAGLIGSETFRWFHQKGFEVAGIENDMCSCFFGPEASTRTTRERLERELRNYRHEPMDIRD